MGNAHTKLAALVAALAIIAWGAIGEARSDSPPTFRYHYISLDEALPRGFERFVPLKITEDRRVYGNLIAAGCSGSCSRAGVYHAGRTRLLSDNFVLHAANEHGVLGGGVVTDPENGFEQAVLFENGKLKRLRRLKGEVSSFVHSIADSGLALVRSSQGPETGYRADFYYYCRGRIIRLPLLTNLDVQGINSHGLVVGSRLSAELDDVRAFRFRPPAGLSILEPVPPYASSRAFGIDERGDVVGYQESPSGSGDLPKQRVGFWRGQKFETYVVQGPTTRFPERAQSLVANEQGLIVAGPNFVFGTTFILPRPGVRIALPEITDEDVFQLWFPTDVNRRGDIIGLTVAHDDGPIRTGGGLFLRVPNPAK